MLFDNIKVIFLPVAFSIFLPNVQTAVAQDSMNAGSYLAARYAEKENDFRAAGAWYARALLKDQDNSYLMESNLLALISMGNFDLATQKASYFVDNKISSQGAVLMHLAALAKAQDFDGILALQRQGVSANPLIDQLLKAWSQLGNGESGFAMQSFDDLAKIPKFVGIAMYHKALALSYVGDFETAAATITNLTTGQVQGRAAVVAYVHILSQLDRNRDALALINHNFSSNQDPFMDQLRAKLQAGRVLPFTLVTSATQGIAEVFSTLAYAVNIEAEDAITLLYARLATYLSPKNVQAQLTVAHLLDKLGQYDLAYEAYRSISPDNPIYYQAEIGRANSLKLAGKEDAALEVMRALARSDSEVTLVHLTLAEMLRVEKHYEQAISAYDVAETTITALNSRNWALYYGRGMSHDLFGNWDEAEQDFRRALEFVPDQPQVLNYLGYSYIDRNENLIQALSMIERAVTQQPDSGYIVDSLAWGLYRLGRYDEALPQMERASLLEPVDPLVTDHLGDIYWAVGRKLEAEFQWRRALSFGPVEIDATRIRQKIELGLDIVLVNEGALPLHEMANGQ
ncbi:MAG: Flp pilus assembly protein TadD [Paracoccaceae bacterium]|jgi:Flp pilus assembly protein TadD